MLTAAIFFKGFAAAKSRLRPILSPFERAAFARQMLLRVIDATRGAPGIGEIAIVTSEPDIGQIVDRSDVRILLEPGSRGLNAAIMFAMKELGAEGKRRVLILPADLPQVASVDIEKLIEAHVRAGTDIIVPSFDHGGTNALIIGLPPRFPLAFGPDSFNRHLANAARLEHPLAVHRCDHIGLDIDQPGDLQHLPCGIMS